MIQSKINHKIGNQHTLYYFSYQAIQIWLTHSTVQFARHVSDAHELHALWLSH